MRSGTFSSNPPPPQFEHWEGLKKAKTNSCRDMNYKVKKNCNTIFLQNTVLEDFLT